MSPRIDLPGGFGGFHVPPGWRKPCRTRHWNDGVLAVSAPAFPTQIVGPWRFDEVSCGVVSDGTGGAFVLAASSELWPWSTQGGSTLRHLSAAGAPGAAVELASPRTWVGVLGVWSEAALVQSGTGRCIVAWGKHWDRVGGRGLAAQRFDTFGRGLWGRKGPILVSPDFNNSGAWIFANNLVAEPDGQEGAILAWLVDDAAGGRVIRAQRLRSTNGSFLWGPTGLAVQTIPGPLTRAPGTWLQLVPTGGGGALVVWPEAVGGTLRYMARTIAASGSLGGAPSTVLSPALDGWEALQRLRRAVPDGAGGLFLAHVDSPGQLRVLRFSPAQGVLWDVAVGSPVHPRAFQLQEDDRGGVLAAFVAPVSGTNRIELKRLNAQGSVTWDINGALGFLPQTIRLPLGAAGWRPEAWSRLAQAVPDGDGGGLLIFQDWPGRRWAPPKLFSQCFDASGDRSGAVQEVSARPAGQWIPHLAPSAGNVLVAWADDGQAATQGLDLWAQRVGCCPPQGLQLEPELPCEILPLPGLGLGELDLRLPCGNRERQFGVLPLPKLFAHVRGLDSPGVVFSRATEPPDWMRLEFAGLPAGTDVRLITSRGKSVAAGKRVRAPAAQGDRFLSLTFKPAPEDELLLVFSHSGEPEPGALTIAVRSSWGAGRPPRLPAGISKPGGRARKRPRRAARTKR